MLSEVNKTQKDKYCMIPLTRVSSVDKFIETESRLEVIKIWEKGAMRNNCLIIIEFLFGINKEFCK